MSINGERFQYDSLMNGSASAVMENLQSHVKQKEGAVAQLQVNKTPLTSLAGGQTYILAT